MGEKLARFYAKAGLAGHFQNAHRKLYILGALHVERVERVWRGTHPTKPC